ncbi:MAG TPA: hypothetical protein VN802_16085 [Stellaceae bacterium]|nr:hypothetical protein [Stellaceae bacterium]
MRETIFGVGVLAALAAGLAVAVHVRQVPPTPVAQVAVAIAPPAPVQAEAAPTAPREPDLPTIVVQPRIVHEVPNNEASLPVPKVTLKQLDGTVADRVDAIRPPPQRATPVSIAPMPLGGAAQAVGGANLSVAGRTIHLFGVRLPDPRDRCAAGPCDATARAALAARLAGNAAVNCTMPPGQMGEPGYICHDASGTDLGGFLVSGGLALADRTSSFQYITAEDAARTSQRGLWRYR